MLIKYRNHAQLITNIFNGIYIITYLKLIVYKLEY